jgi:flagellar biosynthesis protein FlhA
VAGATPLVGFVIFCLLVIIQFVVITRGATRISEVAARFSLDGLPGKQMSIDSDLSAGLITFEQARARRQELSQEADFYGAMDGASRWIRGDAIAALVIVLVNILGGLGMGLFYYRMSPGQALSIFTRLTVGDGLVTQIPAVVIATAAGLLITRSSSPSKLSHSLARQLILQPRLRQARRGSGRRTLPPTRKAGAYRPKPKHPNLPVTADVHRRPKFTPWSWRSDTSW